MGPIRCFGRTPGPMQDYHDREWGVPARDERTLFEFLVLEGAQAGLNWELVLNRREGYRRAFAGFDPEAVARFGEEDVARLAADPSIVRNRAKIAAAVANARAVLTLRRTDGGLSDFLWSFVEGRPLDPRFSAPGQWPAKTPVSEKMSKELARRGFRFVGPVICYALMQAVGLTNDHTVDCFRHDEVGR
jgi:DNA-3-methyladenine glycosylase I